MRADSVDVLVVGGGLVGASAALAAAELGFAVAVVERQCPEPSRGVLGMDLRTVALSPASRAQLEALAVWSELTPAPYRAMQIWEERGAAELRFAAQEVGHAELGWIVEVNAIGLALWRKLELHPRITCLLGTTPGSIVPDAKAVTVDLGGKRLRARLLVAADGARSAVRELLKVGIAELATDQMALATIVRTERPHGETAYQRFLLDGPLAFLPTLDAHGVSVVWSQSAKMAERRQKLDDAGFCAALAHASDHRLGDIVATDRRLTFPVSQAIADSVNPHPRALIVGDAARVVHPLAGLGVNLGFEDIAGFTRVLRGARGEDPGSAGRWREFARRRKVRGVAMMRFLAGLRAFYGLRQPLPHWMRNTGVRFVNASQPLKRHLIREAFGVGPIARGLQ